MQKKILITGYYGFGNTGDEAILTSMLNQFRSIRPEIEFTVISGNPHQTSDSYKVGSVHWRDLPAISEAVKSSDLVIIGGGGLFQDHWKYRREQIFTSDHHSMSFYGGIPALAELHRKPYVLFSVGLGPIKSSEVGELTRLIADQASLVSVRDRGSRDLLNALGYREKNIHVIPDPAFVLEPSLDESKSILERLAIHDADRPTIGVSIRNWKIDLPSTKWQRQIAHGLDEFIASTDANIVFIPFQIASADDLLDDVALANKIAQRMEYSHKAYVISTLYPVDVVHGLIACCDLVLGMRLHSLIFAIQAGVPVVGLSYDEKVHHLMTEFGLDRYLLDMANFSHRELTDTLKGAYSDKDQLHEDLVVKCRPIKSTFSGFSRTVLDLLDSEQIVKTIPKFEEFLRVLTLDKIDQTAMFEGQIASFEKELLEKNNVLKEINSSIAWQGVKLYWRIRTRWVPEGSIASKFLNAIKRMIKSWQRLGTKLFLRALQQRVKELLLDMLGSILPMEKIWQNDLDRILKTHTDAKGVVVILPNIEWRASLFQRPQQMALAFARQRYLVLYLELTRPRRNKRISKIHDHVYRAPVPAEIDLQKYATPMPFNGLKKLDAPIAIAYSYNRQFLTCLENPRVVYEYIDELDVFPYDKDFIENNHEEFLYSAKVVVATAKRLHEEVLVERADAILCPNGVDYQHFAEARNSKAPKMPKDLKKISNPGHPMIGYYGALARWFDYDLLAKVARLRPDWDFVLIGVDYDHTLIPSGILKLPNIHWLGVHQYSELPKYLRYFDVATIPFKVNDITHSTSPLKLFEYFAGHKPVVATAMHEVQRYKEVLIAVDAEDFIKKVEMALTLRDDPTFIARLDKTAQENTWEARVEQIVSAIK